MRARTVIPAAAASATTAVVGGLAGKPAQTQWYRKLKKPPYQPPARAFPIVWPLLYADIALVSANTLDELERRGKTAERRSFIGALALNLVLNASWSWIFFRQRRLGAAAVAAAVLAVSSGDLSRRTTAVRGTRGAPLVLYAVWTTFAAVLAGHLWLLNRR